MTERTENGRSLEARLLEHVSRLRPLDITLEPIIGVQLLGTLQLALRHPANNGPSSRAMRLLADGLIDTLAAGDAEIEAILRLGDDPTFDC